MSTYRDEWCKQGYLVLRKVLPADYVARLRATCERIYDQWRAESTPENTPGANGYGPNAWMVLHLNNPRYHIDEAAEQRLILDSIASGLPATVLAAIFGAKFHMVQTNLYVDPSGPGWSGGWHRDCQFFVGTTEAEINQAITDESDPPREVHMHIPLITTQATGLVPGSHARPDSQGERHIRMESPCEAMPGGVMLKLEPGDMAFFHVNTIHKGSYDHGVPRRTIAVTYSRNDFPRFPLVGEFERRQGYFAPYQPWFLAPGYLDGVSDEARRFYEDFIEIYRGLWDPAMLEVVSGGVRDYYRPAFEAAGVVV